MKKILFRLTGLLIVLGRRGYGRVPVLPAAAAAAGARGHDQGAARRRGDPRLFARRVAGGPLGYPDRAEPVRHGAGDAAGAGGQLRQGKGPDRRVRRFRAAALARGNAARGGADRRADQEGQGRPGHPRQPGPGGPAAHAVHRAPRRTGSEAQRADLGDRREEEPADARRAAAAAEAARERHQIAQGAGPGVAGRAAGKRATRA